MDDEDYEDNFDEDISQYVFSDDDYFPDLDGW